MNLKKTFFLPLIFLFLGIKPTYSALNDSTEHLKISFNLQQDVITKKRQKIIGNYNNIQLDIIKNRHLLMGTSTIIAGLTALILFYAKLKSAPKSDFLTFIRFLKVTSLAKTYCKKNINLANLLATFLVSVNIVSIALVYYGFSQADNINNQYKPLIQEIDNLISDPLFKKLDKQSTQDCYNSLVI